MSVIIRNVISLKNPVVIRQGIGPTTTTTPIPTTTTTTTSTSTSTTTTSTTTTSTTTTTAAPAPSYRYYRWRITNIKTASTNMTQASEFVFALNGVDQSMGGVTIANPNGSNPVGEEVGKLIDGNTNTKWLDSNITTNSRADAIMDFGSQKTFDGYRWATANDEEGRDPKDWTLSGSNDNSTWVTLHTVTGYVATSSRRTYIPVQTYSIPTTGLYFGSCESLTASEVNQNFQSSSEKYNI
jgi:hypothetical protein